METNTINTTAQLIKVVSELLEQEDRVYIGIIKVGAFDSELRTTIYYTVDSDSKGTAKFFFKEPIKISTDEYKKNFRELFSAHIEKTLNKMDTFKNGVLPYKNKNGYMFYIFEHQGEFRYSIHLKSETLNTVCEIGKRETLEECKTFCEEFGGN